MEQRVIRVGPNEASFEAPDVLVFRYHGEMQPDEVIELHAKAREVCGHWPRAFNLVDLRKATIPAKTRKVIPESLRGIPLRGAAFVSGDLLLRTLGKMIGVMTNLTNKVDNPLSFHAEEEEARSWIAARRAELDAEVARAGER